MLKCALGGRPSFFFRGSWGAKNERSRPITLFPVPGSLLSSVTASSPYGLLTRSRKDGAFYFAFAGQLYRLDEGSPRCPFGRGILRTVSSISFSTASRDVSTSDAPTPTPFSIFSPTGAQAINSPILMGLFLHDNHSGKKMQRVIQKNLIPFPRPVPSALSPPVPSPPRPKGPVANIHVVCYDSYRACERRLRVRFACPGKVSVEDVNRIGAPFRRLWTRSARRSRRGSSDR